MSDSGNICVGCKHPIVDESIEGDITLKDGFISVDSKKLTVGEDSGCRNCAVVLDAIVTFVGGEYQSSMPSKIRVYTNPISQKLFINIGDQFEVIGYSGMSEQSIGTPELIISKTFHAISSLQCQVSGTSKNAGRFRKILLRKRLFV